MAAIVAPPLLAAALLVALLRPGWLDRWERVLQRVLRRPLRPSSWAVALGIGTFAAEALVALVAGAPLPRIHDDFSYLLAADTFVHGRLANPTHALWRHFETFHVLVQPTYASKYPPAQGLALAAGQVMGAPILGVWLSGALCCAAVAWMLHGWLRPPWARLGSLLFALTVAVATAWDQGYRGGFVAAAGGALVFGAAARLTRRPRRRDGMALGAGVVVLAASRPWEGTVAVVVALAPLAWQAARRSTLRSALRGPALAALLVAGAGAACLAYYDLRVTGSPWTLPYQVHDRRYATVPVFLWQRLRNPEPSPHEVMRRFYRDYEGATWARQHTVAGWSAASLAKLSGHWRFYVGVGLTPALVALPWALRRRRPRRAAGALAAIVASQLVILPSHPHYIAPGACLIAYLLVEGWRQLRVWRPSGGRLGRRLAATLPVLAVLLVPLRAVELRQPADEWFARRAALQRRLAARPAPQLVLVRYGAGHDWLTEWVYDGADLATTRVLWARSLGAAADCELLAVEPRREAWLLEVTDDVTAPRLLSYPRASCGR